MAVEVRDTASAEAVNAEINKYESAMRRDPGSRAFAALADAYRRAGRLDEAIRTAEQGLKIHPRYLSGVVVLGRAYLEKGRVEDARAQLEKVVDINPDNLTAQRTLGDIYFDRKEWDKAGKAYSAILRVQPNNDLIVGRMRQIEAGEAGRQVDETAEAPAPSAHVAEEAAKKPETIKAAPAPGMPAPEEQAVLSEEEMMDVFFAGVDVTSHEEEEPRSMDYEVKTVKEIFEEPPRTVSRVSPEPEMPAEESGPAKKKSPITTDTMAELYLKQGYKDKALKVYEELYQANPCQEILGKIERLKFEMGLQQEDLKAAKDKRAAEPAQTLKGLESREERAPDQKAEEKGVQVPRPDIAWASPALKEWWKEGKAASGAAGEDDDIGSISQVELKINELRDYLNIIRRGGKT